MQFDSEPPVLVAFMGLGDRLLGWGDGPWWAWAPPGKRQCYDRCLCHGPLCCHMPQHCCLLIKMTVKLYWTGSVCLFQGNLILLMRGPSSNLRACTALEVLAEPSCAEKTFMGTQGQVGRFAGWLWARCAPSSDVRLSPGRWCPGQPPSVPHTLSVCRAAKPPGGEPGDRPEEAAPPRRPDRMASNIFGPTEEPQNIPKRTNPPGTGLWL